MFPSVVGFSSVGDGEQKLIVSDRNQIRIPSSELMGLGGTTTVDQEVADWET